MKKLFSLLKLIKGYKFPAFLNVLFNLLSVVFGLFSLGMLVPFLNLIFLKSDADYMVYIENKPEALTLSSDTITNYFNYYMADMIISNPEGGRMDALVLICILILIFIFVKNLTRYLSYFFLATVRTGVMKDLRNSVYQKVVGLPIAYFNEEKKGDIMSRMTNDVQEVEWTIMTSLEMMFRDPFSIVIYLGTLVWISPELTLFVILILPLSGYVVGSIGKSLKKTSEDGQDQMGGLVAMMEETITGLRIIKAFTAEKLTILKFQKMNDNYTGLMTKMYRKRDLASPVSEFLGIVIMVFVIWYGGRLILTDESQALEASAFIAYIVIFTQVIPPVKSFTVAIYNVQKGRASLDRIDKILLADQVIKDPVNPVKKTEFESDIVYDHIRFKYQKDEVLKGISLNIKKGQTIALVGPSGSGKSTIADLLPRFYDVQSGSISIDQQPITDFKVEDLRALIGIVTQQSILFNDTIKGNILFGNPDATQEEIEYAAKVANAHEFILKLPGGYDYNIGDAGAKLSGGQKQRLSIARAILNNPPILVLDEATSSLDTESEKLVQEALDELMKSRTSIVIAHRLSTIVNADKIYVIEHGKIVEEGTHDQLIEKNNVYKKLYDLQSFN
ncbi:ABC transporter ATP-binding protein [bacterium SCSIO 12643]|nr:ABC transporter ATP-binding protein [bacterium SCSIO 12643]